MFDDSGHQGKMNLPFYETRGIFSDHYLRKWLRKSDLWPKDKTVEELFVKCEEILSKRGQALARWKNESQTRLELIDKVLDALNIHFIPENPSPGVAKTTPDYLLFASEEDKDLALSKDPKERYGYAFGLLEAKKYGHPLGAVSKTETPGRFPHNQIRDYLQDSCGSDGKPYFNWAILTNGEKWRLYNRNTPTSSYFEIDFEVVLTDRNKFKFFYVLFHANAFRLDADGQCLLDRLRSESLERQAELESNLRRRVFSLLETLANGFYDSELNDIDEDQLDDLYEACLIFLYRLLFVLYAEGRGLLPVKKSGKGSNEHYRERYSLVRFVNELKGKNPGKDEDGFTSYYDKITALFDLINGTDEHKNELCNVPLYNGGLFDPVRYRNLLRWKVGDYTLPRILKGLLFAPIPSRSDETDQIDYRETIDYADLEVRQLGSIYEGLLEYHLSLKNGKLELLSESKQRKSTGSYYTPDYIVKYIVNRTVKPLIDRIEQSDEVKKSCASGVKDNSFAKAALKLRVLDPAMGSGHFLVRATERLADEIASHPTTRLAVDKVSPGESHDMAELAYWRRRVVESSIYGVDLDSLAVELAKLSLWLTCISSSQPLNFLDHHLRCGNSLVGTKIADLNTLPTKNGNQSGLFEIKNLDEELKLAVESLSYIRDTASDDLATVKSKESEWKLKVYDRLAPFRAIADLRNSFEFGLKFDDAAYEAIATDLMSHGSAAPSEELAAEYGKLWEKHSKLKRQYHFFHWELEFPDAFDGEDDVKGFDAVMGNPPYGMLQPHNTDAVALSYFRHHFVESEFKLDQFHLFLLHTIVLVKLHCSHGFLIPTTILNNVYAKSIREWILQHCFVDTISVSRNKVFSDSDVHTSVVTFVRDDTIDKSMHEILTTTSLTREFASNPESYSCVRQGIFEKFLGSVWNIMINSRNSAFIERLVRDFCSLGDIVKINRGLITGARDIFFSEKKLSDEYVPIIAGRNIHRYFTDPPNEYILLIRPPNAGGSWDPRMHLAEHKIVIRQIGYQPYSSLLTKPFAITGNIFSIRLSKE